LSELIQRVVEVEAPVHEIDITRRIMDAFSVSRAGGRIVDSVRSALTYGAAMGIFKYEGGFAYSKTTESILIRNRKNFDNSEKKIEQVAPVEIEAALVQCVRNAFTINSADAISEALNQIGFNRSTTAISGHVQSIVDDLLERGVLKQDDGKLMML
jgi:Na+/alanine symporter